MESRQGMLREAKWTDVFWRGLYAAQVGEGAYTVEIDYFDIRERIALYRNGMLVDSQKSPAVFELPEGGRIEVAMALYGVKYARIVDGRRSDGGEVQLVPAPGSAEYLRLRFARRHPAVSRAIAVLAWAVLAVALVTQLPVTLNSLGHWVGFAVPTFALPNWANAALAVAGLLAALDRAFRMKYNPLLDD
ncbi:MAG: hypothetical protein HFJ66_02640 [Eggerthellaceae bacterium]|nr:hypothetical protein [Eggerthellaceae bacterium]